MPTLKAPEAARLIAAGTAPAGITTGVLDLTWQTGRPPVRLPAGLHCYSLNLTGQPLTTLPADLRVDHRLELTDCRQLTVLPPGWRIGTLLLTRCQKLTALPGDLHVDFLGLEGCTALRDWPADTRVTHGWVRARGCVELDALPPGLGPLSTLDLRGCARLKSIPEGVTVGSWVDVGGTGLTRLPASLADAGLRWNGVVVTPQIAFAPETLTGEVILAERNTEVRRIMIERVGREHFLRSVNAAVLDTDRDRGGERRLYRVDLPNDEPLVLVSLHCPSTGRHYLVRVPPTMTSCHAAVAWTAGFDDPKLYAPVAET